MPTFDVLFVNWDGCVIGVSDISWSVTVEAEFKSDAVELALEAARLVNHQTGMPPHGIRVSEEQLRRLAYVIDPNRRPPLTSRST